MDPRDTQWRALVDELMRNLREREVANFAVYTAKLSIRQASELETRSLPQVERENEAFFTYLTIKATPAYGSFAYTLRVRVPRKEHSKKLLIKEASVIWMGTWTKFTTLLNSLVSAPPFHAPVGQEGYEALYGWYQRRKKPFRFLNLPAELRLRVYDYAIGHDIYPRVVLFNQSWSPKVLLGKGWKPTAPHDRLRGTHDPKDEMPSPNSALLCISKKVCEEMKHHAWTTSRQSFEDIRYMYDMGRFLHTLPAHALKNIGLNFNNHSYFLFFGAHVTQDPWDHTNSVHPLQISYNPWTNHHGSAAGANILRDETFPALEHLDIKFSSTRWGPYENPWTITGIALGILGADDTWNKDFVCQKAVTEMILILALEYVHHIKEVNLEGYVKNSTKREFSRALHEMKEDPNKRPTWPFSKSEVLSMDASNGQEVPPRCRCTNQCGFWGVKVLLDPTRARRKVGRACDTAQEIFSKYKWDPED